MAYSTDDLVQRLKKPAGIRSVRLGDAKVTYVPDGAARLRPRDLLPDTTGEVWDARPEFLDTSGNLVVSIGGLLVENGDRALLIDVGIGPHDSHASQGPVATMHGGALLDNLAALGRRPEEIEAVAFTHLHPDHIGWAWHPAPGGDRPPFAHADYLMSEPEWAHRDVLEAQGMSKEMAGLAPSVRTVADGQEIFPGVRMRIGAGHSPGHAEYVITSGGQRLIAFGDAMLSSIQVEHPEWPLAFDGDPVPAADYRRRLVADLAEPDTIGFGIHFADVVFGHVRRDGDSPTWRPLDASSVGDDL
ncbi:MBL fold metallo-hydrolase [Streptomyces sp. NPDC086843]|uniref:MBL fold metallo-hydrolase n=1 Tax=Streptomyces sp. NPDC086843 TaxID=3365763 RepID=UPI0038128AE8